MDGVLIMQSLGDVFLENAQTAAELGAARAVGIWLNLGFLAEENPSETLDALVDRMMVSYVAGEIEL
jgi:hypothetical protein